MTTTIVLTTTAPYRLDLVARIIKRRPENGIDHWDDGHYRRIFDIGELTPKLVTVDVAQPHVTCFGCEKHGDDDIPHLIATVDADLTPADHDRLVAILRRSLALDVDLTDFWSTAEADPRLTDLAARYRGMRVPRFPTLFEAIVSAIACQQVTLNFGMTLATRLCDHFDPGRSDRTPVFPRAETIAGVDPATLRTLAFSTAKARAIVDVAGEISFGSLREADLEQMDNVDAVERLKELRGIGQWTAEYVLLRGLGRIDIFPAGDAGGRANLANWLGIDQKLDHASVLSHIEPWTSHAGILFFLLMLRRRDLEAFRQSGESTHLVGTLSRRISAM